MNRKFNFLAFLIGSFFLQCGNHFFALGVSALVLMTTTSVVKSSLVMVFSVAPAVFFSNYLGQMLDKNFGRKFITITWSLSIATTFICGLLIWFHFGMAFLYMGLAMRSVIGFVARTSLTKWLKLSCPSCFQESLFRLFYFSFFSATIVSGLLVGLALIYNNIFILVSIEAILIIVGGGILLLFLVIPESKPSPERHVYSGTSLINGLQLVFRKPDLYFYFLIVVVAEACFQGAYTVLVATLPLKEFQMGSKGVTFFQIAASLGIVFGFIVNWLYSEKFTFSNSIFVCFITLSCLLFISFTHNIWLSLFAFLGLNFFYECVWLYNETTYFKNSPSEIVGQLQFLIGSTATFMMGLLSLIYAELIDNLGFSIGTKIYCLLTLFLFICLIVIVKNKSLKSKNLVNINEKIHNISPANQ